MNPYLVGLFLWRQSFTERIAVGTFARLWRGQLLTTTERQQAERFMVEEILHADGLRRAARRYVSTPPPEARPAFTPCGLPEHLALATTYIGERLMEPGFHLIVRAFETVGDGETAAFYRRIQREEAAHIAFARAVLGRLRLEAPAVAADTSAFIRRGRVVRAFKTAAPDQRWIRETAAV